MLPEPAKGAAGKRRVRERGVEVCLLALCEIVGNRLAGLRENFSCEVRCAGARQSVSVVRKSDQFCGGSGQHVLIQNHAHPPVSPPPRSAGDCVAHLCLG